jgi:hypothetical protein
VEIDVEIEDVWIEIVEDVGSALVRDKNVDNVDEEDAMDRPELPVVLAIIGVIVLLVVGVFVVAVDVVVFWGTKLGKVNAGILKAGAANDALANARIGRYGAFILNVFFLNSSSSSSSKRRRRT